jgi:signal transduction histidine kinase
VPNADDRDDSGAIAVMDQGETDTGGTQQPAPGWLGPNGGRRPLLGDVRNRVLVSFLVLLIVSTAASLLVLREVLLSRLGTEVQERLTEQVDSLRLLSDRGDPATGEPFGGSLDQLFMTYLKRERPLEDGALVTYIEGEPNGSVPEGAFADTLSELADITQPTSGELSDPAGDLRFVAVPVTARDGEVSGVLVAAKLLTDDRDRVESAVRISAGVSIVVTLLASLFIWLAAGRAVQPLRALARTTRTITETDLTDRVPVRGESEIAELGRTFNGMLDRLQSAFADQKEFLADVGHELRTPITVIRGNLETLGDDPAEREEAIMVINDELERMSRLVDDLLLLARSDRPDFLRLEPLDLDILTHELFAKARTLGVRRWLIDRAGVGLVHADPYRLTSAVMNLAENAVRHTRGDQAIAIGSSIEGGTARIWVRDEGQGIEPNEQQRIFERFASGGPGTAHGAGLGLAIVTAIAEAHDGRVELESTPGAGSKFTIVIPVQEAPPREGRIEWPES